jgi:tRNA(Leu) C34 or U34 (ribose-2'-O)-methylase TrmL
MCINHGRNSSSGKSPRTLFLFSKKAERSYTTAQYADEDYLVFGPETRGLPEAMLIANGTQSFRIPMMDQEYAA